VFQALAAQLSTSIRDLVDQLQIMNQVEFMDAHDWVAKLSFYTRLSTEHSSPPAHPPYLLMLGSEEAELGYSWVPQLLGLQRSRPALIVTPSLYQYFIEANDLRDKLDAWLRKLDLNNKIAAEELGGKARALIRAGTLPQRLRSELEIAAVELAPGGKLLKLQIVSGTGPDAVLIGESGEVRAVDFVSAWLEAVACKFSSSALALRLSLGLADEEHPLTVVAYPADKAEAVDTCALWSGDPDPGALVARLEQILPRITQLHVFQAQGAALRPEHCRSLHDLVCLCLERGLAQIFSFAGEPARGLGGIKQLRLEIPVVINIFNLGGGLFPSAAERASISMEDVRSIPAWSLLLGLVSPAVAWTGADQEDSAPMPHYSSYAVLSQFFVHSTLRLAQNLYVAECCCDDALEKYVQFRFKGGSGRNAERRRRLEIMRLILEGEGFEVISRGDYLEAMREGEEDVYLQRNLVCIGLLIAWIQSTGVEVLGELTPEQGRDQFRGLLTRSMTDPN
jgi:hypothetical protein